MKRIQRLSLILLLLCGSTAYFSLPHPESRAREVDASWVRVAHRMGIQNMVTAVYLGPRVFDTFVEVMVVILTVYGMKFVRDCL